jgi:hypothetical protein
LRGRLACSRRRASDCLRYFSWPMNRPNQSLRVFSLWHNRQLRSQQP